MITVAELEIGVRAAKSSATRACRLRTLAVAESTVALPVTRGVWEAELWTQDGDSATCRT
jgi:hypothetical protein